MFVALKDDLPHFPDGPQPLRVFPLTPSVSGTENKFDPMEVL